MVHYKSPKTGKHTTWTDEAIKIVRKIERWPEITKIYAGEIRTCRPANKPHNKVRINPRDNIIRLKVRGPTDIQEVRIYSSNWAKTFSDIYNIISERR